MELCVVNVLHRESVESLVSAVQVYIAHEHMSKIAAIERMI